MGTKNHISSFGGNGDDITIFGESAGGNSVINHLTQKLSYSLYTKAIVESGTYVGAVDLQTAQTEYASMLKKTRCTSLECLLKRSAKEIEQAARAAPHFGPVIDGVSLAALPNEIIKAGQHNTKVPVLMGSNRDELAAFLLPNALVNPPNMRELELDKLLAAAKVNVSEVKRVYDESRYSYPAHLGNFSHWWWVWQRVNTDQLPEPSGTRSLSGSGLGPCGVRAVARGLAAVGSQPVFVYFFAHPTEAKTWVPGSGPGSVLVGHGAEVPYVFGATGELKPGQEAELALKTVKYWITFAQQGDPNSPDMPKWPRYEIQSDTILRVQTGQEGGIIPESNLRKFACDYWETHPPGETLQASLTLVV